MDKFDSIQRKAPAKVNLTLAILGKRPDGYHEIESWMVPLSWRDSLSFRKADAYQLSIAGSATDVPSDSRNLVTRAHAALAAHVGQPLPTRIELDKRIPTGAGLGGGSSDAAATLVSLNQLWDLQLSNQDLLPIAAGIGSDVPFFLTRTSAIVQGRGECVSPVPGWNGWLVLIIPTFGTSTASVYAQYASHPTKGPRSRPWELPDRPARDLQDELFNDLQAAAFTVEPRLTELHRKLDDLEGHRVMMSGSGSTLYAIFDDEASAMNWRSSAENILAGQVRFQIVQT